MFVVRMHYMIFHVSRLLEANAFKTHLEVCEFAVSIIADQHAKEGAVARSDSSRLRVLPCVLVSRTG